MFSDRTWQVLWKNLTGLQKAAEHLWCDFKWAINSSPNTNDLCTWVQSFHSLQNWCNRDGNTMFKYMNYVSIFVGTVWKCFSLLKKGCQYFCPYNECKVISVWWWVYGSFKVTPEVFSCFLQTSQVLPHWLNHFSLILLLYTETLSC